jgi:hypothetical protein
MTDTTLTENRDALYPAGASGEPGASDLGGTTGPEPGAETDSDWSDLDRGGADEATQARIENLYPDETADDEPDQRAADQTGPANDDGDDDTPTQPLSAEDLFTGDGQGLTVRGAEVISAFGTEAERFQSDLQQFAYIKQAVDFDALAKEDPAQADALKAQMADAERELRERHKALLETHRAIGGQVQAQRATLGKKELAKEQRKLDKAVKAEGWTDFSTDALKSYLIDQGLADADVSSVMNHTLVVLAEKARRYDAAKGRVKARKGKSANKSSDRDEKGRFQSKGDTTKSESLQELRARLHSEGKIDASYARLHAGSKEKKPAPKHREGPRDRVSILYG